MGIDRRRFAFAATAVLAAPAVLAQSPERPRVIGVLRYGSKADFESYPGGFAAFREGLREEGFVEGRNLRIEYRFADYHHRKLDRLARELVRADVDLIYAATTWPAYAAQAATKSIPIVFSGVNDPVHVKLVKSLARPGGNITGVSLASAELTAKRVELMREAFPGTSPLGVVYDEHSAKACQLELRDIGGAGTRLGVKVQQYSYAETRDLEAAFAQAKRSSVAALLVPTTYETHRFGADLAARSSETGIPLVHSSKAAVEGGGLMSYGPDENWASHRAGVYAGRILRGASPAELPVERPTKYELVINLKTARAMGIVIPPSVLLRADRIIE